MKKLLTAAAIGFASLAAHATDIGLSAAETYAKIQKAEPNVLFIDVRDPIEIMFVGASAMRCTRTCPSCWSTARNGMPKKGVFRLIAIRTSSIR